MFQQPRLANQSQSRRAFSGTRPTKATRCFSAKEHSSPWARASLWLPRLALLTALLVPGIALASPSSPVDGELPITLRPLENALGTVAERGMLTVSPPLCEGASCSLDGSGDAVALGVGRRLIYLNFEGVTLTSSNQSESAINNISYIIKDVVAPGGTLTVPPFDRFNLGSQSGATSRQEIIDYTIGKMREYHAPYNFEFTTTRPASGVYNMIVFGGRCTTVVGTNCAGIALLDCGDNSSSNIVFAFPEGMRAVDLATTATQEMAHALGLTHTLDQTDFMYPTIRSTLPTHFGAGAIPNKDQSGCGGGSYQDSHQMMLSTVGLPGQDETPPSVRITSPSNGQVVTIGDTVAASVTDDSPISKVEMSLNGTVVATKTNSPYTFTIPPTSPLGKVRIDVRATDSKGNEAGHKVNITIGTGNEEPCNAGQCPDGFTCSEDFCYADTPVSTGAIGELCANNEGCDSSTCVELDGTKLCSQACDANTLCPDGFECLNEIACWPIDSAGKKSSTGLCSIAQPGRGFLGSLAIFLMAILALSRRRKRS